MHVASLHIYPVKSTRAHDLGTAEVEPWGLAGDRRWMVVDDIGTQLTARNEARLLTVTAWTDSPGRLTLHGPHAAPLALDANGIPATERVRLWASEIVAVHPSPAADAWFSRLVGRAVRLVWLDDPTRRLVNPAYGGPADRVSFADGYPLLLTATASLQQLHDWMASDAVERGDTDWPAISMRRFRPSLVVDTDEPFAEDRWRRIQVGPIRFRAVKGCDRCALTTIDPHTLARGKEPLRTLARHRKREGKVWFGVNLIPDNTSRIAVGDPVTVLE